MYNPPQEEIATPRVVIFEQPAPKALRFRYECEGRSAGSIPGVNSTPENKTFPTIKVVNYQGRAVVVVSCVTKDPPYRTHPHNLVGKDGCKRGVCTLEINQENMTCSFSNLGIQCVKKKDIEEALNSREAIRVDPFRLGFEHKRQPTSIDLNAVRLCFQVFLEGPEPGKFKCPLKAVVSDPIYDKKAMSDLTICRLSDASCNVSGGREIILLCEKVAKEDISVRFYEEKNGRIEWEALGEFSPTDVHKQVAISFRVPSYRDITVQKEVDVKVQLRRPSDGATSEPRDFKYTPLDSAFKRKSKISDLPPSKRAMIDHSASSGAPSDRKQHQLQAQGTTYNFSHANPPFPMGPDLIKREPNETNFPAGSTFPQTPPHPVYLSPNYPTTSTFVTMQPQPAPSPHDRYSPIASPGYYAPTPPQVQSTSPYASTSTNTFTSQQAGAGISVQQAPTVYLPPMSYNIRPPMPTNIPPETNVSVLLNMDTQQNLLNKDAGYPNDIPLESGDISWSVLDNALSANLSGQLRLYEGGPGGSGQNINREEQGRVDENMSTDSISRLAINTYDEIVEGKN